ncbi:unnamed protein product [Chondrus crispus]|uniref:PI3K/PI4K catalytic domain-containing protein n=1 Tax=Chondrus crispus TaxID=2769 RepID=R7QRM1_CHOCR|nr:unnamed protein product [Chondrus crispus]CDF40799.1 unnamed protein product [Chondrus crispus]|eukprot:XP_005711093.1 unnamed protein product [Chondrus crispus]
MSAVKSSLDPDFFTPLGTSLPSNAHRSFHASHSHMPTPSLLSQDDLATVWSSSRPSVELVSRAAKKWVSGHPNGRLDIPRDATFDDRILRFEPWDFSEVALATDEVRTAFQRGSARAERPPREGVCGTYFIRGGNGDVLCVFKPVDEEATDIDMSPPALPAPQPISLRFGEDNGSEFSLGPAHGGFSSSPLSPLPDSFNYFLHRTKSLSSDSGDEGITNESFSGRSGGFHAGEGAYKEVAAYLLDHDRFARVPQTALATCKFSSDVPEKNQKAKHIRAHSISTTGGDDVFEDDVIEKSTVGSPDDSFSRMRTKMGALQVFMKNVGDADDFGPGVFDKEQVQRIAILDIRTLNHDRHGGNILVTKSIAPNRRYNLVPIDHGYILPETVQSIPWPVWMDWPMVREPLSDRLKNYIAHLDADSEANILDNELDGKLLPGSLQGLKIATMLLQKGVAAGLTLYDIGLMMYSRRDEPYHVSELTKLINEAEEANVARERNFSDLEVKIHPPLPISGDDHLHRRHQSMSSLYVPESFSEDYVTKYAKRRIHDVIALAAAKKENEKKRNSTGGRKIPRSRSIPDFGVRIKPLQAIVNMPEGGLVPAPTPASSPVATTSRSHLPTESLEAQMFSRGRAPCPQFQIPIDDGMSRIALPEPIPMPAPDTSLFRHPSVPVPLKVGRDPQPLVMDRLSSGGLPPLFKPSVRKSSPVAPQEFMAWETGSS